MHDVVAVLSDPFFFTCDAQHELQKRNLETSGPKATLLHRLFEALEAEYTDGWTLGYLLNTKILQPNNNQGRSPRSLIGHHIEAYNYNDRARILTLQLSDGEDATILSYNDSHDDGAKIKMDHDLFWTFHTLDGMKAVPRNLATKPLLITDAVEAVRRDRWGNVAGLVFGLKLQGMKEISFFSLAGKGCGREDRLCGDVWLGENEVLREDIRMLHGGEEMLVQESKDELVSEEEEEMVGLEEDLRDLHGYGDDAWE